MKHARLALLALAALLLAAPGAMAASPVIVSHTLTGYTPGANFVSLTYNLHIENITDAPISNVRLDYVPILISTDQPVSVVIDALAPSATTDHVITFSSPTLLSADELRRFPLLWTGTCLDEQNYCLTFPTKSREGGQG